MDTVCKYFLTNSCRYGDRCRFSHVLPNENYRSNPYVYDARQKSEGVSVMQRLSAHQNSTTHHKDEIDKLIPEYLKKIAEDVNQIEQQHMWPLTCYSFLKTQGNLPGWNDISMEEVRWEAYQAHTNGTTHIYLSNMQELLAHARELRNMFLKPSAQTETIIREYMKGNNSSLSAANENVSFSMNQPTSTSFSFASAFDKTQPSVFNQTTNTASSGVFNQPLQSNTFNQIPPSQQSFFGIKSSFETHQSDMFKNAPAQELATMDVGSNIFGSGNQIPNFGANQHFQQVPNKFGQSDTNITSSVNMTVYSKGEDLSEEDYQAFKATTFTLENLPFAPPSKELCH